jgi:hypothetical protein
MNWLKLASSLLLLMAMTACANFPFFWRQDATTASKPHADGGESTLAQVPAHVRLELHDVDYDGKVLSGRLLISPVERSLRLDKRLISNVAVRARSVSDCTTGRPVEMVMVDRIPSPARDEDLLILNHGYWYGGTIHLPLFIEHITGNGPECVDAEFSLFSFDGEFVATLQVHAARKAYPSTDGDGGLAESPQPPADAGSQ